MAMIINEAWHALAEEVSTKNEIDTAMKLGTNYPYGPFEWAEKIGLGRHIIEKRLRVGWSIERTLTTPSRIRRS